MKKEYVKPIMESEMFVANEYVAACTHYYFNCFKCGERIYTYDETTQKFIFTVNPKSNSFYIVNDISTNSYYGVIDETCRGPEMFVPSGDTYIWLPNSPYIYDKIAENKSWAGYHFTQTGTNDPSKIVTTHNAS